MQWKGNARPEALSAVRSKVSPEPRTQLGLAAHDDLVVELQRCMHATRFVLLCRINSGLLIEAVRFEDLLKMMQRYIEEVEREQQNRPKNLCAPLMSSISSNTTMLRKVPAVRAVPAADTCMYTAFQLSAWWQHNFRGLTPAIIQQRLSGCKMHCHDIQR